ncbi:MAG: hypothetical protein ACO3CH_06470 [Ilumatobacteraceae bacterium]|jgi:hypothetical protein
MNNGGLFGRISQRIEEVEEKNQPITMSDILNLPDDQLALMRQVLRASVPIKPEDLVVALDWNMARVTQVMGSLSFAGMIELVEGTVRVAPMQKRARSTPGGMWSLLEDL